MAYSDVILAEPSLTAYWKLDESSGTVADDAKGTADLTIAGGVTLGGPSLVSGGVASVTFARAGLGRASKGSSHGINGLTIEGWFRSDDATTGRQCLFYDGTDGSSAGFGLFLNHDSSITGSLWILEGRIDWRNTNHVPGAGVHHFALTLVGMGTTAFELFIDGVSVWSASHPSPNAPSGGFTIGAESSDGVNGFNGALDDIAVYDAVLDDATILAHHEAGLAPEEPPPPPDPAVLLATWITSLFDRHESGAQPYEIHAPFPNGTEHYDPMLCFMNARDYCLRYGVTPDDWSTQIANAVAVWRDQYILIDAGGGQLQLIHTHTHGLARHYLETGEPESLTALERILPGSFGVTEAMSRNVFENVYWTRENAFRLLGCLDRDLCGLGEHENVHWCADMALQHCDHLTKTPEERYGVFVGEFIWALAMRSLICYWFRYRDSTDPVASEIVGRIPAGVEASVARIMAVAWWHYGESHQIAFSGAFWDKGTIKYCYPAGDAPTHAPIEDLVIESVISDHIFTVGASAGLSAVDDFYKNMRVLHPDYPNSQVYVYSYEGSTRTFTVRHTWESFVAGVGDVFTLDAGGKSTDGVTESPYPDGGAPPLNPLLAPAAAWAYWHRKVVMGDAAGAAEFRTYHEMLWQGQVMTWEFAYTQKEWNEGIVWGPSGIGYRDAGDADADTIFDSLTGDVVTPPAGPPAILLIPDAASGGILMIPTTS